MPDDADFDRVPAGSMDPNACTPTDWDTDWSLRGVRIATPKRAPRKGKPGDDGEFTRIIVAGFYQLDSNYLGLRESFRHRLVLVASSLYTHRVYAGNVPTIINAAPTRGPVDGAQLTDADWAGRSVTHFFNPNIVATLSLPEQEDEYVVYAVLGAYVSNVTRVVVSG